MSDNNIYNKKGFTLLELLIAISIFGIISVMTFSIINIVPKLAKAESSQFNERTYVRRAVTEITNTIQSANEVSMPSFEFKMPNGDKVLYQYEDGNVNKYVNGVAQRFMESIAEFQITNVNDYLFNIHIKTSKEGKVYDFKVEMRRGMKTKTEVVNSTITPTSAVFDKNSNPQQDITVTLNLNGNNLERLTKDGIALTVNTDYTISNNILTLKKEYLAKQSVGMIKIIFEVSRGENPELTVEIRDTGTYIKIEGNSFADDIVRMYYPGNLQIDPYDDQWIIDVTNVTLIKDISEDKLEITGLPQGIHITDISNSEDRIVLTLSGSASAPITTITKVDVVVKATAVTNTSVINSERIKVLILPDATFASPEHNLLFTNEVYFKNNVTITGDIVIGRGADITYIETQCNLNGNVYVDSSLTVKNNITVGSSEKPGRLFVKGSVNFGTHSTINGDLYYRDQLVAQNGITVTGRKEQRAVEIPPINIPKLKQPEQWYEENGYIVKTETSIEMDTLQSNKKYFFKNNVELRNGNKQFNNVTLVGKGDIIITNKFTGSGIIFAPNGKVYFKNGCIFTGMCVSNETELNSDCTLNFQRYPELPFDYNY